MRINRFVAQATGMSRRSADNAISSGRITINGQPGHNGVVIEPTDTVELDGAVITTPATTTIILNKPRGFVCSRNGQGSKTIYDLLPDKFHTLKPVGRLDKDSSGLLLLTNEGDLANKLTHPRYKKVKVYQVKLNHTLAPSDEEAIDKGVTLDDGVSRLNLNPLDQRRIAWEIRMSEGRNRQIRRTFEACGYRVVQLHRIQFGEYNLGGLGSGQWEKLDLSGKV